MATMTGSRPISLSRCELTAHAPEVHDPAESAFPLVCPCGERPGRGIAGATCTIRLWGVGFFEVRLRLWNLLAILT
jgi:hypothetical protein